MLEKRSITVVISNGVSTDSRARCAQDHDVLVVLVVHFLSDRVDFRFYEIDSCFDSGECFSEI